METRFILAFLTACTAACAAEPAADPPPTRVRFNAVAPAYGNIPFPTDLLRSGDRIARIEGFDRLVGAHPDVLRDGLAALDGFGRTTASLFFVDGPLSTVSATSVTASLVELETARVLPVVTRVLPSLNVISVLPRPGTVLAPGKRYAIAISGSIVGDDAWRALVASKSRATAAEKLYGDALDVVERAGVARSTVAGMTVFTTSRAVEELPVLRKVSRTIEPRAHADGAIIFSRDGAPSLDEWLGAPVKDEKGNDWPGLDNTGGVAHDAISAVATFSYESPSFLDPKTKHIEKTAIADPHARVPVTMVVPLAAPPPGGYPVIVAAHGLGGTRNNMLAIANELARAGFLTVGIDDVAHGARRGTKDLINNYGGTYRGPDGLPDRDQIGGIDFFAGFTDLVAIRDNFRQTVLDHVALVKLVQQPNALDEILKKPIPLDPTRVFWTGGSFGGIMGATTVAIEPELRGASLQVPGGGFIHLLIPNSEQMRGLVRPLIRTQYRLEDEEPLDAFHPLLTIAATVVEAGDPLAFAPHVFQAPLMPRTRPAQVLLTYALDDEVLPNEATHALIRAMGLPQMAPAVSAIADVPTISAPVSGNLFGGTGVAVEYAPAVHALGYQRWGDRSYIRAADGTLSPLTKTVRIEMPLRQHLAQGIRFFQTAGGGTAEVIRTADSRPFEPR